MTAAPDLVHGAWTRRSVSIDDGPHFETQMVVWLQAGTCFADLRVPFHPAGAERCFAGRSGWDGDRYRWMHRINLENVAGVAPPSADDVGDLSWEEGVLVERGMFPTAGSAVAYTELWERLDGDHGAWLALEGPGACLVRIGEHAITVVDNRAAGGGFAGVYRRLGQAGWWVVAAIGDPGTLPCPDDSDTGWRVVHRGITASREVRA